MYIIVYKDGSPTLSLAQFCWAAKDTCNTERPQHISLMCVFDSYHEAVTKANRKKTLHGLIPHDRPYIEKIPPFGNQTSHT